MPSDSEVINAHIRAAAADQHTSIPAVVVSFDGVSVTVKADIDQQLADGTTLQRGEISNVPVQFAGSSDTLVAFPLKAGHTGMLVFQERSMDEWVMQGADNVAAVTAKDRRMHDYNDCVFVPGVAPHAKAKSSGVGHTFPHNPQTDTVIKHNIGSAAECAIKLSDDGAVTIQNQNNTMTLAADGTFTVLCKDIVLTAENSIGVTGTDITVSASGDLTLEGTNILTTGLLKNNSVRYWIPIDSY